VGEAIAPAIVQRCLFLFAFGELTFMLLIVTFDW